MAAGHAHAGELPPHDAAGDDAAHGKAPYDDINVRPIALVIGVGSVLAFVAIVSVQVIYYRYSANEYVEKVEKVPTTRINEILAEQRAKLESAGPGADAEKGEKSVPIDQAMKAVVTEYQQRWQSQQKQQAASEPKDAGSDSAANGSDSGPDGAAKDSTADDSTADDGTADDGAADDGAAKDGDDESKAADETAAAKETAAR